MSFNKKAMARYMVYDRCLRDESRKFSIPDLIEQCNEVLKRLYQSSGVSRRQVYYDLEFMKSPEGFSAPICSVKNEKGKKVYFYEDKTYSIFSFLSGEDWIGISEIIYLLQVIMLLSGKDFVETLISERGYKHPQLNKLIHKMTDFKGLWNDYHYLKKLYILLDALIRKEYININHENHLLSFYPETVSLRNNDTNVLVEGKTNTNQKYLVDIRDLEILKKY